jgi:hypothetical protein
MRMPKRFALIALPIFAGSVWGTDLQGLIVDWNCAQQMAQKGRLQTLKNNRACSLMKDYNRATYGLITSDQKYYRFDDNGNRLARVLLANTPDKDNLKVIVSGEINGPIIKVTNMSEL